MTKKVVLIIALGFCGIFFALYLFLPIPKIFLDKIPATLQSQLPKGWLIENWVLSRSYLRQWKKGELPNVTFDLTNGVWRISIEAQPRWNGSLSAPEIRVPISVQGKSSTLKFSRVSGDIFLDFKKQFKEINTFKVSV